MDYIHQQALKDAEAHLYRATQESSYYRSAIDIAKEVLKETFTVDGQLKVPPISACLAPATRDITMHFSFDMAQQVCYSLVWHEYYCTLPSIHVHACFRCTIPATRNNQDRCTSSHPASVQFSGCAVRRYQGSCALIRK